MGMNDPYRLAGGNVTAEEKIAGIVQTSVLPSLVSMLATLDNLSKIWNAPGNAIPAKILAHAQSNTPLAGYSVADWIRWGETFKHLTTFLGTEFTYVLPDTSEVTITPEDALLTTYVKVE